MRWITMVGVVMVATGASARDLDPRYVISIEVDRPVLEPGDSAQVLMRAGFRSDVDYSMHLVRTNLHWDPGPAHFEDIRLVAPMDQLCFGSPYPHAMCRAGEPGSDGILDIIAGQVEFGDIVYSDPSDPIAFWTARYTAPAAITQPISVDFFTRTTAYVLHVQIGVFRIIERTGELVEGSATITIVPCRADFNGDGAADLFDFLAFMNAFDAGESIADFDFDGELTVFDFLAFQNRFDLGC